MPSSISIVGHAIISANGMIATSTGAMPEALFIDADQAAFQHALDASALVVLGRKGHQRHPNPGRRRLVLTRSVSALQQDPHDKNATYWNPADLGFAEVLNTLQIQHGTIAITGGQSTFDLFLPWLTQFHLVEVRDYTLLDGLSCFSAGHPNEVLAAEGLLPSAPEELVPPHRVTKTIWRRPA